MAERPHERGSATAELAVALPAVTVVLGAVLAVAQVGTAQVGCVDAARAGARAAARGDPAGQVRDLAERGAGGPGAAVVVRRSGGLVSVVVSRRVRLLLPGGPRVRVSARSVAAVEGVPEAGSATVLVLALCLAGLLLAGSLAGLTSAVVARHRAQAAADLGALAAADVLLGRARGRPCPAAARVVAAHGAVLATCRVSGRTAQVAVQVAAPGLVGALGPASARARAGPAPQSRR